MKTKYAVIYNPNAGKKQKDRLDTVQRVLTAAGADFIVLETDLNNRPRARTEEAIRAGRTGIIGCGGDGTINEIGSVVYRHPDTVLGIVPTGSGNDIARSQGLPLDAEKAVERILKNVIKETDCGFANDHFFLNIASIGFDAEVVHKKTTLPRWVPPNLGYRLSVLLLMLAYRENRMRIRFNEHEMDRPMLLCAVGVGRYYGGGIEILPNAVVDDGAFEICAIQNLTIPQRFVLLPALGSGKHLGKFDTVRYHAAQKVTIETDRPGFLNIDGELIPGVTKTEFVLVEKGMRIFG